ncbi:DUF6901 family protein, partial [Gemmatimonadota bacterium]
MDPLVIRYRFEAEDGTRGEFEVELDPMSLHLDPPEGDLPDWTLLEFRQCPHCPLDPSEHSHCPAAAHLPRLVQTFNHLVSYARVRVEVVTAQRTFIQDVSVQQGIGALMGLIMATSGCPLTLFFRPMARFHLPFSNQDETIYRAASAYLLTDYFRTRTAGTEPDLELKGLSALYRQVHTLNSAMAERLRVAARTDSSVNALVHLDMFALMLPLQVERQLPGLM